MKHDDVNHVYKTDDCTKKMNYRPVSMLSTVFTVFERLMNTDITNFIEEHLSNRLGFRHGHSDQATMIVMLEELRKYLDKGMRHTDLFIDFACLIHDLLIAKLNTYGFGTCQLLPLQQKTEYLSLYFTL